MRAAHPRTATNAAYRPGPGGLPSTASVSVGAVERRSEMLTAEEYAKQPFEARLARLARTPDELAAAIHDQTDAALSRRPDPKNWAAKEVICHLRDTEEVFFVRFHAIVENDEPKMYFHPDAA